MLLCFHFHLKDAPVILFEEITLSQTLNQENIFKQDNLFAQKLVCPLISSKVDNTSVLAIYKVLQKTYLKTRENAILVMFDPVT